MYLVFTRMPGESYRRRLRCLLLCLCDVFGLKTKLIYIHENMDNQNHCMRIKQARLIVNAHKHNLINLFCNNRYVCLY